jgi:hypothetical protein
MKLNARQVYNNTYIFTIPQYYKNKDILYNKK